MRIKMALGQSRPVLHGDSTTNRVAPILIKENPAAKAMRACPLRRKFNKNLARRSIAMLGRATPRVQAAGEVGSAVDEAGVEIVAVKLVMGTAATTKAGTADRSTAAKAVGLVMAARTTATDLIIGTQAKNLLDHSNRQTMAMPMAGVRLTRPPCPVVKSLANRVARLIAAKT